MDVKLIPVTGRQVVHIILFIGDSGLVIMASPQCHVLEKESPS